jgi:uncharacterized protein (TIGR03083 family)
MALLTAAQSNFDAPLPSCPGWTMERLVAHIGGVWGWAARVVATGERADRPEPENLGRVELVDWAQEQAAALIGILGVSDPGSNCWTFGEPRNRLFWYRREALETAVHAWDAQLAVNRPELLDPDLSGDGIDEFLTVVLPRYVAQHPGGWTGQSLHLHRTDGDGEWTVRLGPDAAVSAERAHGKADVALRGPAAALYLWCLNRAPSTELELLGDSAIAERWGSEISF